MSRDAVRRLVAVFCALGCVACPLLIVWLGYAYGYDRLRSDDDYRAWHEYAVDALFWLAVLSTTGFIFSMRRWWRLAALVALPLLGVTGVLAALCGLWIDGTYF